MDNLPSNSKSKVKSISTPKKMYFIIFFITWGIFCVAFFLLPDFLSPTNGFAKHEDILYRILAGFAFGIIFGGLFGIIYKKRRKIEWGFIIFAFAVYIGLTVMIAYFYADKDLGLITLQYMIYSLLISFPATLGLIELLEAIL